MRYWLTELLLRPAWAVCLLKVFLDMPRRLPPMKGSQ